MAAETYRTDPSHAITITIRFNNTNGHLAKIISTVTECQGEVGEIVIAESCEQFTTRDFSIDAASTDHQDIILAALKEIKGIEILNCIDQTMDMHVGGKLEVVCTSALHGRKELSQAYTPGVARACKAIHKDKKLAKQLTIKKNTVAVVSDGTAVLGLGDIGPEAAMPVMEGKGMLFKEFAGVDAFPICLDTKDVDEIVKTVKLMAPTFGGINLEDISAPRCFEIEQRLQDELDIPIFHDDQHGTAVVLTAGFINALKLNNKKAEDLKVVVVGVGAAGTACTNMLLDLGVKNIIGCDRKGALSSERTDLTPAKQDFLSKTNPNDEKGTVHDVIKGADVFVGLSGPNLLGEEDMKNMNPKPMVFAMSNPVPEIMPEVALPYVSVMATGRSDYPNQINNVLCFPGLFRGVFDCNATTINEEMKMAAAIAIAETIKPEELKADYIIPSVFNKDVAINVAEAVAEAATKTGVAQEL